MHRHALKDLCDGHTPKRHWTSKHDCPIARPLGIPVLPCHTWRRSLGEHERRFPLAGFGGISCCFICILCFVSASSRGCLAVWCWRVCLPRPFRPKAGPTFGGDSSRGGRTDEAIVLPLQPCWTHQPAQAPCPAWADGPAPTDYWNFAHPLLNASDFDHAFHVAVADGRLFYGSSADDALRCLDAASGAELWSFVTGGPIRIAPTVHGDRVLVASDDGCLYGLEAASGRLVWTYRAARGSQRLPGNQRMISRWPVRCGIAVRDDTAYVAAGVFPSEGADLCAVRIDDGAEVWRAEIGVSPQGHLAATDDLLIVPTGRTAPAVYDRRDGKLRFQLDGTGSTYAAALPDTIVYGPDERGQLHIADPASGKKLFSVGGRRLTPRTTSLPAWPVGSDRAAARRVPRSCPPTRRDTPRGRREAEGTPEPLGGLPRLADAVGSTARADRSPAGRCWRPATVFWKRSTLQPASVAGRGASKDRREDWPLRTVGCT
jgi:hypothetical protein